MKRDAEHPEDGLLGRLVRASVLGPLSPLLLVVAAAAGAVALIFTPREEEPQIVVPSADVMVSFPGASAQEVERLAATPLERYLWQIDGVEHVYSVSRRGGAVITVRFFVGQDREQALVRLQSKIDSQRDQVPPGVTGWVVRPVEIDDVPILALTLHSKTADEYVLRRAGEELLARLEGVADVSKSAILGGLAREVRVELDVEALAARGMTAFDLEQALRAADSAADIGTLDLEGKTLPVRAGPNLRSARELETLVVGAFEGRPVLLRDVARVVDGPAEPSEYVHVNLGHSATPEAAVTLAFSKKKGTNAVGVARALRERAAELAPQILPAGVQMLVTRDSGQTADDKVDELLFHLALAVLTVIGLIALVLGWREGLIVAAAVPVTFALTLVVNLALGYTINRVTLFALVLVLGLVCDDPIVDVENIHRHLLKRKGTLLQSVLLAVQEVRPPVIVATLAVVLSFVPLFFITGMMGPYMRPMALNVPVAMAMSLLVAFTLTPWMSYRLLKAHTGEHASEDGWFSRAYRRLIVRLLDSKLWRGGGLALLGGLCVLAGVLVVTGAVPLKMLPYDNKSEFELLVDLPEGTALEDTDRAATELAAALARHPEVVHVTAYVGLAGPIDFNGLVRRYGFRRSSELADLRVGLTPKHERSEQSHAILLRLRAELEEIAARHQAEIKLVEIPPGPPVLSTLVAELTGPLDLTQAQLVEAGREMARRLELEKGVVDVDVMAEEPHARVDFELDRAKAAQSGVSSAAVVHTLEIGLAGAAVATLHEPAERYPLELRLTRSRAERSHESDLGRMRVRAASGDTIALSELGSTSRSTEDQTIYHKDLERTLFVIGEIAGRPPAEVVLGQQSDLVKHPLPHGVRAAWSGEGEWKITLDVFRDLGLAFGAALVAIYVLLVMQTGSFGLPILVMLSIPLGMVGVLPGFWLLNLFANKQIGGFSDPVWFTATGMIGIIALAGIVVRNAIILLDFIRAREAEGATPRESAIDSGLKRARPIALTAGAAMLGAWPITLDPIFSGLAWSLIFGMLTSTVFTLIVVPVVYAHLAERKAARA
ncbi:MAG: efflux RND transporter permease subunit [Planctomycetes bacterium]|nr:efflux RND transporter permease subunit [Planctomycetota bacterium]